MKFDWNDIALVPSVLSTISTRKEVNIFDVFNKLPLFTAPMDKVVDDTNVSDFDSQNINVCLPRHVKWDVLKKDNYFYSYGLDEIIDLMNSNSKLPKRILIDIAQGHMLKLWETAKEIKEKFGNSVELMVGNIANPDTYREYCKIGVDYIRVGIGGGCFTPDSQVMTDSGYKSISDIEIGNMVLTHTNQFRKVLHKFEFHKTEKLIKVNDISCTKNHEFYVINKKERNLVNESNLHQYAFWISAEKLDKTEHLLIKY